MPDFNKTYPTGRFRKCRHPMTIYIHLMCPVASMATVNPQVIIYNNVEASIRRQKPIEYSGVSFNHK